MAPNFVQDADEYELTRSQDNEIWIKGFKGGETRVRPLIEATSFKTYQEHYAEGFGYFPCSKLKDCVGCTDESARTRERIRRWAFNALNDRGHQQVYKIGFKLQQQLKARQARVGTICDRDYIILRTGAQFNETQYSYEPGDKDGLEYDQPLYDIPAILSRKYADAVEAYTGVKVNPGDVAVTDGATAVRPSPAADEAQAVVVPAAESEEFTGPSVSELTGEEVALEKHENNGVPKLGNMSAGELRLFLQHKSVEYPERAPRSRLLLLAEKWLAENPPF
jgi:hypothetical protein